MAESVNPAGLAPRTLTLAPAASFNTIAGRYVDDDEASSRFGGAFGLFDKHFISPVESHRPTKLKQRGLRKRRLPQDSMRQADEELAPDRACNQHAHRDDDDVAVKLALFESRWVVVVTVLEVGIVSNVAEVALRPVPLGGDGDGCQGDAGKVVAAET